MPRRCQEKFEEGDRVSLHAGRSALIYADSAGNESGGYLAPALWSRMAAEQGHTGTARPR